MELKPKTSYPQDYRALVGCVQKEIKEQHFPDLNNNMPDLSNYDVILLGTPNWCGTVASPLAAFLKRNDFTGKKIGVFCSHGGGGISNIERDVKSLCPSADVLKSLSIVGNDGKISSRLYRRGLRSCF